jgi:hypothetical protein
MLSEGGKCVMQYFHFLTLCSSLETRGISQNVCKLSAFHLLYLFYL